MKINFEIKKNTLTNIQLFFAKQSLNLLLLVTALISVYVFFAFYDNGLGLAYNDARSHLDIARRVVEGLKPGVAQLGSVWLPLPHVLMALTVWNDFMWHTGLSGAIISMISFVTCAYLIFQFLKEIGVGIGARVVGALIFVANLNVLYLQSTAMTELLLLVTMMAAVYYFLIWVKRDNMLDLAKSAFFIFASTLVRYEGWFLFLFLNALIGFLVFRKKGYKTAEGNIILFSTLAGFGIFLWVLWNLLIFKDPLYFIFGPYAAATQQEQLRAAGVLATKGNFVYSLKVYLFALIYNSYFVISVLGLIGSILLWFDKKLNIEIKIATLALFAPLIFNVLALFMGQSVLFIQGLSGNTWFNVRYGIMMMPAIAIFVGYLIDRSKKLAFSIIGLVALVIFFSFANLDAVTIDDARVGASQKNVSEVSSWLAKNTSNREGFVLISAASHDAIIFSSGLPMSKFIHEGTGLYWDYATTSPQKWARWIVMRTNDTNDLTFKLVRQSQAFRDNYYKLVDHYPFADIYELKSEYISDLNTKPNLPKQR